MPSFVLFGAINVNTLDTQSFVSVGENAQHLWDIWSRTALPPQTSKPHISMMESDNLVKKAKPYDQLEVRFV